MCQKSSSQRCQCTGLQSIMNKKSGCTVMMYFLNRGFSLSMVFAVSLTLGHHACIIRPVIFPWLKLIYILLHRCLQLQKRAANKDTVLHKFACKCSINYIANFQAACREAQMTFPGQLPSCVFAVGDHVSHERRRRRRAAEAEWLTDKWQNESRVSLSLSFPLELEKLVTRPRQWIVALFPQAGIYHECICTKTHLQGPDFSAKVSARLHICFGHSVDTCLWPHHIHS